MSIRVMTAVWDHSPAEGGRLLVLLAIADAANDDAHAWPSVKRLAERARLSERQVSRALMALKDAGELEVPDGPRNRDNPFRVLTGHFVTLTPTSGPTATDVRSDQTPVSDPYVEPSIETSNRTTTLAVNLIWGHYVEVTGSKRTLDDKRKRIIRNAHHLLEQQAKAAGETDPFSWAIARAKLAVDGLSRSPWHHGENPQGKKYLEIRYALKGLGDESDDERIDKMCDLAVVHDPVREGIDAAKVERWLDHVRYTARRPHSERDRALASLRKLREAGFTVTRIDRAPWVVIA